MGRRRYPALDSIIWPKPSKGRLAPEGECEACSKPAVAWARIEWSYMNGEDETELVCQRHANMAEDNFDRYRAHVATKDKFLVRASEKEKK